MDEWMDNEWMNKRVTWMMNEMIFNEISYIFCDFQLERDQPTDQPTDRPTDRASYRGAMAHLKRLTEHLGSNVKSACNSQFYQPTDTVGYRLACTRIKVKFIDRCLLTWCCKKVASPTERVSLRLRTKLFYSLVSPLPFLWILISLALDKN